MQYTGEPGPSVNRSLKKRSNDLEVPPTKSSIEKLVAAQARKRRQIDLTAEAETTTGPAAREESCPRTTDRNLQLSRR
jgi:hypothetical protein